MASCGWCLGFDSQCCHGRFEWCEHGSRCDVKGYTIRWNDIGATWCFEHGREDWCDNKARREGTPMSKVTDEAWELMDAATTDAMAGDPTGKAAARGMAAVMATFLGRDADDIVREAVQRYQARHA